MTKELLEKVNNFISYHDHHKDNPVARNLMVDDAIKIFREIAGKNCQICEHTFNYTRDEAGEICDNCYAFALANNQEVANV